MIIIKIAIIGDICVGKSTLVLKWKTGEYKNNTEATVAASYITKDLIVDGQQIKCRVWDTAGTEKYRSLIPIYLRDCDIVIICFTELDLDKIQDYVNIAKDHTRNAAFYLAMTKSDIKNKLDISHIKKYAEDNEYGFFKTSSLTGEGVEELFTSSVAKSFRNGNFKNTYVTSTIIEDTNTNKGCCTLL